jgi:hypothetical protein
VAFPHTAVSVLASSVFGEVELFSEALLSAGTFTAFQVMIDRPLSSFGVSAAHSDLTLSMRLFRKSKKFRNDPTIRW